MRILIACMFMMLSACAEKKDEPKASKPIASVWTTSAGETLDFTSPDNAILFEVTGGTCRALFTFNNGLLHFFNSQPQGGATGCSAFNADYSYFKSEDTLVICDILTCDTYH